MSLTPEIQKKLDGWILGLTLIINSKKILWLFRRVTDDPFGLGELLEKLKEIRNFVEEIDGEGKPAVLDLNVIFGVGGARGRPKDYENERIWMILLSWIYAMRCLEKKSLESYLEHIAKVASMGWDLNAKGFEVRTLQRRYSKWRESGSGAGFDSYSWIKSKQEIEAIKYLQGIKTASGQYLKLWEFWPLGQAESLGRPTTNYVWDLTLPNDGFEWVEAELSWEEHDDYEGGL